MNEQENTNVTNDKNEENDYQYYIDAIKDYQNNYVPKARFEKLQNENKQLVASLTNGELIAAANPQVSSVEKKPITELIKEMKKPKSSIEMVEKALEFRERVLEETGEDCFVNCLSTHSIPTEESYRNAQKTADIYRECLDYANGDNEVFINELQRRMVDNPMANIRNTNNRR